MWFAGSVVSLMAWIFASLYLGSLSSALATEVRRGFGADPAELMRLGNLIEGAALLVDVAFFLFVFLLVVTVGLLVYADGGPRQWGLRQLARDDQEEAPRRLVANIDRHQREAREREERP